MLFLLHAPPPLRSGAKKGEDEKVLRIAYPDGRVRIVRDPLVVEYYQIRKHGRSAEDAQRENAAQAQRAREEQKKEEEANKAREVLRKRLEAGDMRGYLDDKKASSKVCSLACRRSLPRPALMAALLLLRSNADAAE